MSYFPENVGIIHMIVQTVLFFQIKINLKSSSCIYKSEKVICVEIVNQIITKNLKRCVYICIYNVYI